MWQLYCLVYWSLRGILPIHGKCVPCKTNTTSIHSFHPARAWCQAIEVIVERVMNGLHTQADIYIYVYVGVYLYMYE